MEFPRVESEVSRDDIIRKALDHPFQVLLEEEAKPPLYNFLRMFWSEVSEDAFKDNWHVRYLCNQLEEVAYRVANNEPKKYDLIINIPPGTTKTIICSIMFPAWCWSMGWYYFRFICASYSDRLALESAEKSRDLIRSEKFQMLYPDLMIKDDKDTKSNFRIVKKIPSVSGKGFKIRSGGNRFSTSVGGTLTGFHGHILIIDDPLNPQQAASEKELLNCNNWMEQTLPTRKTDKDVTATVLVMQRLHENDPTGRALARKKHKIKHICLPGEIRNYRDMVKPSEAADYYEDDLLDPVRLGWNALKDLEDDLGQYGFAGQVGQNPVPPGGGMFKVDNMPTIDGFSSELVLLQKVRYWDKASTIEDGAYTAGVKMFKLRTGKFVIADVVRGQWSADKREQIIRNQAEADGRDVRIGLEQEPGSGGKESVQASIRNLAGFSVIADRPTGDKVFRADPFSVQVNNGNVLIMPGAWNESFIHELRMFPFGTYKDQVDAASGAFHMLTAKREARVL